MRHKRIIPLNKIPPELWNGTLHFPDILKEIYSTTLSGFGLQEKAKLYEKGVVGGQSDGEAEQHFAQRFLVSSSRVEIAYLDPCNTCPDIHNILNAVLSEGKIGILDVACGSGAATISLLTTMLKLRQDRFLPNLPLSIKIVGGDYSRKSLDIFEAQLKLLVIEAEKHGITLTYDLNVCDLCDGSQISPILDKFLAEPLDDYLVLIANLSSALTRDSFRQSFEHALNMIITRLHGMSANIISIEPSTSKSEEKGLLKKIISGLLTFFSSWKSSSVVTMTSTYKYCHWLIKKDLNGNVSVKEMAHGR